MVDQTASRWLRTVSRVASTRPAGWFFVHVTTHVDRRLLRITGGRISRAPGVPVLCLEVVGRTTGRLRRVPVVYVRRGDDLVVVASAAGQARNPAWFHNIRAAGHATVYASKGLSGEYTARVASGAERAELWSLVLRDLPGFANYETRVGSKREMPVIVLTPAHATS